MKTLWGALALALIACAAVCAAIEGGGAETIRSSQGAYRMRLCELALATGEVPRRDSLLQAPGGVDQPYGVFAPAATAFVLARVLDADALAVRTGEFDEDALARGSRRLAIVLSVLSLGLLLWAAARERRAPLTIDGWSLCAALNVGALALFPTADAGAVRAPFWGLGACAVIFGLGAGRSASRAAGLGQAFVCGLCAGIGMAIDPFLWPALFAPALADVWRVLRPSARHPDERRALLGRIVVFAVAAALVVGSRAAWPAGSSPGPRFEPSWPPGAPSVAILALLAWTIALLAFQRRAARVETQDASFLERAWPLALAAILAAIDARFAPALAAWVAWLAAAWLPRIAKRGAIARALFASLLFVSLGCAWIAREPRLEPSQVAALRELRSALPSTGAWNHPFALHAGGVLVPPALAGAFVFHARRATVAAQLPSADPDERARVATRAFASAKGADLAAAARELAAAWVWIPSEAFDDADLSANGFVRFAASAGDGRLWSVAPSTPRSDLREPPR